jgi:hypothetical protein
MPSSFVRYPKPRLRPFLLELFSAWGCRTESESGAIEVDLSRSLRKRFGGRKLRLLLSRGGRPPKNGGELMVPGNPVYRNVLDLAKAKGAVGRGFAPMPGRGAGPTTIARTLRRAIRVEGSATRAVVRENLYHPVLLFHFSISYGAPEVPDEIRTVGWDAVGDEAYDTAPFAPGEISLEAEPRSGAPVTEIEDVGLLFPRVQIELEARIAKKVTRTEARARRQLDKERARIESYYRRMIQEEKSRPRSRADDVAEIANKIELLQLDWKRKLSEATERLKPRINVRLFCIEEVFVPRARAVLIVARAGSPERECYYDRITKGIIGPACDVCGGRSLEMSVCRGGHLCCSQCVAACSVCGEPFCQQCWSDSLGDGPNAGSVDPEVMMEMDPRCAGGGNPKRGNSR